MQNLKFGAGPPDTETRTAASGGTLTAADWGNGNRAGSDEIPSTSRRISQYAVTPDLVVAEVRYGAAVLQ